MKTALGFYDDEPDLSAIPEGWPRLVREPRTTASSAYWEWRGEPVRPLFDSIHGGEILDWEEVRPGGPHARQVPDERLLSRDS